MSISSPDSEPRPVVLMPELQDPTIQAIQDGYTDESLGVTLRFERDMPLEEAARLLMKDEVDIVLAGSHHNSVDVMKTILAHFKDKGSLITSHFVMEKEGEDTVFWADCAVIPHPTPNQQVHIAEQTCESAKLLGFEPIVAFLSLESFESEGSENIPGVMQVREAARRFKEEHPEIPSYGPIQYDAATNRETFFKKAGKKDIELVDDKMPNVFIFPDGFAGNIAYKVMQRTHTAIGPRVTGTTKPFEDMSRGGTVEAAVRQIELARTEWLAKQAVDLHLPPQPSQRPML